MRSEPTGIRSGKHVFDNIYDAADPRPYWGRLAPLRYHIPASAQEVYGRLVDERRQRLGGRQVSVTDLCCSYGTTAALLKHTCNLDGLIARYTTEEPVPRASEEMLARDESFFASRRRADAPRVLGVDTASNAVTYAVRSGLLDAGFVENLEVDQPTPALRHQLATTDLVTVTGGVGYIGATTFDRVLAEIPREQAPWVAAFVLRWIDYAPVVEVLDGHGLVTERLTVRTFPQRRFADDAERHHVMSALAERGTDPDGKELEGYHHAELWLSRPPRDIAEVPLDTWFGTFGSEVAGG